ncbi:cobalt-precorrin-5B (C1)-methyltransferase [Candidatus Johnevansia muelleri]|uniref:Cobalt-precorrin-5B C(1)-methyltransferase n=1 Tax=Candidatus Johnevansia muelleri TaxID=1495769 RepID=A0A078KHN5_9GAMM|nr:cobalt-precorrin-5B (C1)-methyltransferase [Candidatus Evansia muelleri]
MYLRGWTTGCCATAATIAAYFALSNGYFPKKVIVNLPKGDNPLFGLVIQKKGFKWASAGVVKNAGDDPDVTHGVLIISTVRTLFKKTGIIFKSGPGVGIVTKSGLPIAPGEPAINPIPRKIIIDNIIKFIGYLPNIEIEISVPGGEKLVKKTLNERLGIIGGISILGTTGIVIPFSCSAWIYSIHQSIDVAIAEKITHIACSIGIVSENSIKKIYKTEKVAFIKIGNFIWIMLKYLQKHPVKKLSLAGGIAKILKLAKGILDLNSQIGGSINLIFLASLARYKGASLKLCKCIIMANTVMEGFLLAISKNINLGDFIAKKAKELISYILKNNILVYVIIYDRQGICIGKSNKLF